MSQNRMFKEEKISKEMVDSYVWRLRNSDEANLKIVCIDIVNNYEPQFKDKIIQSLCLLMTKLNSDIATHDKLQRYPSRISIDDRLLVEAAKFCAKRSDSVCILENELPLPTLTKLESQCYCDMIKLSRNEPVKYRLIRDRVNHLIQIFRIDNVLTQLTNTFQLHYSAASPN